MIYLEYKDFNQLYHDLARYPITHEKELEANKDFFIIGASLYINNLIIKTESCDCNLDLADFNYTKAKWTTLVNKYIDEHDYYLLKQRLVESTAKTLTFNFKIHIGLSTDNDQTKNRDSCLVGLVFSRNGNKGAWTNVSIYYRTIEIFKKGAIDLLLFNRMFNDLPNLNLKEYIFHIPQGFYSSFILSELIDSPLFTIEEFKDNDSFIGKKLYNHYIRYYSPDSPLSNYHAIRRKQEMKLTGKKLPSIPKESLQFKFKNDNKPKIKSKDIINNIRLF